MFLVTCLIPSLRPRFQTRWIPRLDLTALTQMLLKTWNLFLVYPSKLFNLSNLFYLAPGGGNAKGKAKEQSLDGTKL